MTAVERKNRIMDCITQFLQDNGYPPSIREVCSMSNVGSLSTVSNYVNILVREGRLKRNGNQRRCVVPMGYTADPAVEPSHLSGFRRVCLRTSDGGTLELDYSIVMGSDHQPECTFDGILDCSRIRNPVSRIVGYRTEMEA